MLALKRHLDYSGKDGDVSHENYHDDAVLEFPQSGEQFEVVENSGSGFGSPLLTSRSTPAGSLTVVICGGGGGGGENLISYDGAPWILR